MTPLISPLERFRTADRFGRLMEEMFPRGNGAPWLPIVDVKENDNTITFIAELPGIRKEDVDIELEGDMLTISGKREYEKEERKEDFVRIERDYGKFQRSFRLPTPVEPADVKADFKDGLLKLTVPRKESARAHKVLINAK